MLVKQFLRFTGVGAIGTAGHYMTLVLLVEAAGVDAVPASLAGFVVGALINYHLNRSYTFQSDVAHRIALPKFFTIAAIGALLNTMIMSLAVHQFDLHYLASQVLATGIVLVWGFLGNHLWTFSNAGKENV
jgi:putative flippase GtrA